MKENKEHRVTVRISDAQNKLIEKLIADGTCKTPSAAVQYILNIAILKGIID
ncbi:hypothetical protein WKH49_02455 [Pantoea agglomerans]|uniref:hypothetical protein n=1 Tax=Enterobacter agglomerans TaxID=549 RepID=UPI003C7E0E59